MISHRSKEDLCQSAQDLAEKYHCTAVLKDATTIVAREDDLVYINQSGNDGMATGGSGDVLAGMITGLLGEGLSVHEAAVHGVYLHGLAGDPAGRAVRPGGGSEAACRHDGCRHRCAAVAAESCRRLW